MAKQKVKRKVASPTSEATNQSPPGGEAPQPREPSPEIDQLQSSQASVQSASSSTSPTFSITLPDEVIEALAHALRNIDALGTLASLSLSSKDTRDLVRSLLFDTITIRSHAQLAAILSSLDISIPTSKKRHTRLSGPRCDPEKKLVSFAMTKHLHINNFPSMDNLDKLRALEETFAESTIFSSAHTVHLSPVLTHRFHPAGYAKKSQTVARLKEVHLLHRLASPNHLTVDLRGADADFHAHPSAQTPHECTCVHTFCQILAEMWEGKSQLKLLTVYVDPPILSTHFFSTTAKGPALEIVLSPSTQGPRPSPRPTKKTRKSSTAAESSSTVDALALYVLNQIRQLVEFKGGSTTITITRVEGDEREEGGEGDAAGAEDGGELLWEALARAKELGSKEEAELIESVKGRRMLKGLVVVVAERVKDEV